MVIDVCTYNGEKELWDIHYNCLKDHVDEFIVVEFDKTFSGADKLFTFPQKQYPLVKYWRSYDFEYQKYRNLAESSPNTVGADHWKREFMQKEAIKEAFTHLSDYDTVFIGDVDEIWNPKMLQISSTPLKLKLEVYTYYLNNLSSEQFWGTVKTPYQVIKNMCLNDLRTKAPRSNFIGGWHFTSMGGAESVHKKLTDSYTQESYATPQVLDNLAYNIASGHDFLGRDFTYKTDDSNWPQYLRDNRDQYKHLLNADGGGGTPLD